MNCTTHTTAFARQTADCDTCREAMRAACAVIPTAVKYVPMPHNPNDVDVDAAIERNRIRTSWKRF